jgi:hypothetical protein
MRHSDVRNRGSIPHSSFPTFVIGNLSLKGRKAKGVTLLLIPALSLGISPSSVIPDICYRESMGAFGRKIPASTDPTPAQFTLPQILTVTWCLGFYSSGSGPQKILLSGGT